ncbi:MAG: hypothetical protein J6K84_00955 [Oscillospiraceae bacterium]|nr:hypothetical protein [Oscillospiraceae bacterium]
MKLLGLDIGTTTVSAVVVENGCVLASSTVKNDSFLTSPHPWERVQDPNRIRALALSSVDALLQQHPDVERIGVTGQMHGIVYLDQVGAPVSPLYTWQDGRGDLPAEGGETFVQTLSRLTGYPLATGFGLVTHASLQQQGLLPPTAKVFCTIHDYLAMVLAGSTIPVTDCGDAASMGIFSVKEGIFDLSAMEKAGIDTSYLPKIAHDEILGYYRGNIAVYPAIGDNQASFLGSVGDDVNAILVNVGTGSQFSAYTPNYLACKGLETRPFPKGGYLVVGSALCGGRAYALLETFFRETVEKMTGTAPESCYDAMGRLLQGEKPANLPILCTQFQGTREDPQRRGSIQNLSTENFTPTHLAWAMVEGMCKELHDMYLAYLQDGGKSARLVGSGNGLRRNPALQDAFCRAFGQDLTMSSCMEEAAAGAAIYAGMQ